MEQTWNFFRINCSFHLFHGIASVLDGQIVEHFFVANSIRTVNPFVHPFWCRVKLRVLSWFLVFESLLELGGVLKVWRRTCSSFPNSPGTFLTPPVETTIFWDLTFRGFSPRSGWLQPRGPHPKGPVREFHRSGRRNWHRPYGGPSCAFATCWVHLASPHFRRNNAAVGGMIQSQTQDLWQ